MTFNYKVNRTSNAEDLLTALATNREVIKELTTICESSPGIFNLKVKDTKEAKSKCKNITVENKIALYEKHSKEPYFPQFNSLLDDLYFVTYGVTSTLGRQEYKYFSETQPTKVTDDGVTVLNTESTTENPWGLSGYVQYLKPNKYAVWGELSYQKGYKAGDDEVRCLAPEADAEVIQGCITSQKEAPKDDKNLNLTLGVRSTLPGLDIPFSLSGTYDFEDDEHSVAFPIYLIKDGKSNWTAGIRYDYDSGKTGSTYSFFVGSRFDFSEK